MSVYYRQDFVSPEKIFFRIKEELRSYYDSGAVDDTLFPLYVEDCLRKLGKASYPINQAVIHIDGYKSSLPEDFYAVREAWMCTKYGSSYQLPSSTYIQETAFKMDTLSENDVYCAPCEGCQTPDIIEAIYKITNTVLYQVQKQYLLTPGNLNGNCPKDLYCANFGSATANSYDVKDGKMATTFREGIVYLQYYSNQVDDADNQLVPDEIRTQQYIELYIKQKMFEQIFNQTTDETFNQSQAKYMYYKQLADEAYILATIQNKKEDAYRQQRAINRTRRRLSKFNIR